MTTSYKIDGMILDVHYEEIEPGSFLIMLNGLDISHYTEKIQLAVHSIVEADSISRKVDNETEKHA